MVRCYFSLCDPENKRIVFKWQLYFYLCQIDLVRRGFIQLIIDLFRETLTSWVKRPIFFFQLILRFQTVKTGAFSKKYDTEKYSYFIVKFL